MSKQDDEKVAKEIADSAIELHTNDEIEELANRIKAALETARKEERERLKSSESP